MWHPSTPKVAAESSLTPPSDPQMPARTFERPRLAFERERENQNFRSRRSPLDLEAEAIDAEMNDSEASGWTTRSL